MSYQRIVSATLTMTCVLACSPVMLLGQDTAQLIDVLRSEAPLFEKAKACQRLSIIGDETAVPALARLLDHEQLSNYARCGLEGIPHEAAEAALRDAVSSLNGQRLVGVLNSIGARGDARATDLLAGLLQDDDPAVATAAARSLARIGTLAAADLLREALSKASAEFRPSLGSACLLCAQRLAQQAEVDQAVRLYDAVRDAQLSDHLTLAGAYDAIVALGADGLPRLVEQLDSEDDWRFRLALQAARRLDGDARGEVSTTLAARLASQSPSRQALTLIALGDLGHGGVLPTVVQAAREGERETRLEAIRTLATLGDASAAAVLLEAATHADEGIAAAARAALAVLDSGRIDAEIAAMLDSPDAKTLDVAIDMAGQRGIASAAPKLLALAVEDNATIRLAAIRALGTTARIDHLAEFITLTIGWMESDDFAVAESALRSACMRMPQEACAQKLAAAMSGQATSVRVFLLEQLTAVGGTVALETVVDAARGADDAICDAATRLLGQWSTADAAPAMLKLARTLTNDKYKVRALRGYVRIARQLDMTPGERVAVCRNTLAIAQRDDDRLLVLEVLRRYPTPEGLALAVSLLDDEALRQGACATVVSIAAGVAPQTPEPAQKALRRALELATDSALKQEAERQLVRAAEFVEQHRQEAEFVPLFNGRDLDGWQVSPGVFRVEQGAIVGGDLEKAIGKGNDFACTTTEYGDFELRLEFKLLGSGTNGGVNLRSRRQAENGVASGYQADLGAGWWGCLYDEARRNRVLAASMVEPREKPVRLNDWNDYRIRCEGRRIRLWINGVETVDYSEPEANVPPTGIIALQVQAGRPVEAWYRNIRIKQLGPDEVDRTNGQR